MLPLVLAAVVASVDFHTDVRPILETSCVRCHARGAAKGGFSLETRDALVRHDGAVVPGDASASWLLELVRGDDPDLVMPLEGERLTAAQIATLATWIDEGAAWPDDFAFRPMKARSVLPRRPAIPDIPGVEHPVDRFIAAEFDVEPAPVVDDRAFLRRASLDLIGLQPTVDAIDAFVADSDPDKRTGLIRDLLADRHAYAQHWLTFWNDLLRNDYSGTGYIDGGRRQITPWLYDALVNNKPYDEFVRELVDPIPETRGFAAGIAWRGESSASQIPELQYARVVSQVFLGTNVKCASCHDSFINDWKLADTYGLAAVIADRPLELHRCEKPTGTLAEASFLFPEVGTIDASASREDRLRRFSDLMVSPDNGRLARTIVNRLWARLFGRGLVEPVDEMDRDPWSRDLLDYLAADLVAHGYDLKHTLELMATSTAYQRRTSAEDDVFVFRGPAPKRLTAEQFMDALWAICGAGPGSADGAFKEIDLGAATPVRASVVRSNALTRALGRPNREQVVSVRPRELMTLQALDLANGAIMANLVRAGAERLGDRFRPDDLIDHLFLRFLARHPTDDEAQVARELLEDAPADDLIWILAMHPEFQLIP